VLAIHFVEATAICFQADLLGEIGVARCKQGVVNSFGVLGVEDNGSEVPWGWDGYRRAFGIVHNANSSFVFDVLVVVIVILGDFKV
jgi:hypothetical protein